MKKGELGHGPHIIDHLGTTPRLRRCPACRNPYPTLVHHHRHERRHRWLPWPTTRVTTWSYQCGCGFATTACATSKEAENLWQTTSIRLQRVQADTSEHHQASKSHRFEEYPTGLNLLYNRPVIEVNTASPVGREQAMCMVDLVAPHLGRDRRFMVRKGAQKIEVSVDEQEVPHTRTPLYLTRIQLTVTGPLTGYERRGTRPGPYRHRWVPK